MRRVLKAEVQIGTQLFFARNRFESLYYDVLKAFRPKFAKFHRQIFISVFQWEMGALSESGAVMGLHFALKNRNKNLSVEFRKFWLKCF